MAYTKEELKSLTTPNPEKTSKNFRNFDVPDWLFTLTAVSVWIIARNKWGHPTLTTVIVGMAWYLLMDRSLLGRRYHKIIKKQKSRWIVMILGRVLWQAGPRATRRARLAVRTTNRGSPIRLAVNSVEYRKDDPELVANGVEMDFSASSTNGVATLVKPYRQSASEEQTTDIGLLHSDEGADSIVLVGSGSGIGSQELGAMFHSHAGIADVVRMIASLNGVRVGVSWFSQRRPQNVPAMHLMQASRWHPNIWAPVGREKPQAEWTDEDRRNVFLHDYGVGLNNHFGAVTPQVTQGMVITLKREGPLSDAAKGEGLTESQLPRLKIIKAAEVAISGLTRQGIFDLRTLTTDETRDHINRAWNVKGADWYHRYRAGLLEDDFDASLLPSLPYYPQEEIATPLEDTLVTDGTHHAVLMVTDIPPDRLPAYFHRLSGINVPWITVSTVGEAVKGSTEYFLLDRYIPIRDEFEQKLGRIYKGPKQRKKDAALEHRLEEIFESVYGQDVSILVQLSHITQDDLEDSVLEALRVIRSANMNATRIEGEAYLLDAVLMAGTGVAGLL